MSESNPLRFGLQLSPLEPLWKRVPTKGDDGRPLSDFMMLIPGLRRRPVHELKAVIAAIQTVLTSYGNAVVFADLNLRLSVLWVSVRPIPGICLEVATAINARVPEARLVANKGQIRV
jgi:hypothetical protein